MRKEITGGSRAGVDDAEWVDLEALARVEVSSEAAGSPIEGALMPGGSRPWVAGAPGKASVTLRFDAPREVGKVRLQCIELEHERSQEWALHALLTGGGEREVLRQQWNFSPGGSTTEDEVYTLNLPAVAGLRLTIDPDRGRDRYPATLAMWRVG